MNGIYSVEKQLGDEMRDCQGQGKPVLPKLQPQLK